MAQFVPAKEQVLSNELPKSVQIEGLVLLRVIKHCQTHYSQQQAVGGRLLGLQNKSILEVTNCFPSIITGSAQQQKKYDEDMSKYMSNIREDNNPVGWYRSAINGLFFTNETIKAQYNHQKNTYNAICLMYDPSATKKGRLIVRAFRLKNNFIKLYETENITSFNINKYNINSNQIFEELTVKIHNSHLIHALLFELKENNKQLTCQYERLHHYHQDDLISNLRQLATFIDAYGQEAQLFRNYFSKCSKRKIEKEEYQKKYLEKQKALRSRGLKIEPLPDYDTMFPKEAEPSRLESVTVSAQMGQYAEEIEHCVLQGLSKLWVTQGFHGDNDLTQQPPQLQSQLQAQLQAQLQQSQSQLQSQLQSQSQQQE